MPNQRTGRKQKRDNRHSRRTDSKARTGGAEREGATEQQVGDRTGPGAGYDKEPLKEKDKGGVTPS